LAAIFERFVVMNARQPEQFVFRITVEAGEVRVEHPVELSEPYHKAYRHRFELYEAGQFVDAMAEAVEVANR
jgi:hypothetical protein